MGSATKSTKLRLDHTHAHAHTQNVTRHMTQDTWHLRLTHNTWHLRLDTWPQVRRSNKCQMLIKRQTSRVKCQVYQVSSSTVSRPVWSVMCPESSVSRSSSSFTCQVSSASVKCQSNVNCQASTIHRQGQVPSVKCKQVSSVQCQVSSVKCQVLNVKWKASTLMCQVPPLRIKSQVSTVKCQQSTIKCKCQVSSVKCQVPSVQCPVPTTNRQVPREKRQVSSVKFQVSSNRSQVSSVKCQAAILASTVKCEPSLSSVKRRVSTDLLSGVKGQVSIVQ
jgi:hypothetical protein